MSATFEGIVRGIVEPVDATSCVVRFSANTPALLLTQVAAIASIADFAVDHATPETAALIAGMGSQLAQAFSRGDQPDSERQHPENE